MNRHSALRWLLGAVALVLLLAAGYLISLYLVPTPQIAIIRIEGDIWGDYATYLSQALEEAGKDPAVHAVVLDIASPGGEVTASESLYFDVLRLRERMPVIASINELAASGAYYVAAAADQVYAKPASEVGNIGVISLLPESDLVDEKLLTTGPFKLSGGPQVTYVRQMDMLKDTFLAAIFAQRSERLTVGPEILSRGELYLGLQAQQMGLIDEIGSQADAIDAAARMARVRHYDVMDRTPELPEDFGMFDFRLQRGLTARTLSAAPNGLPPGFYFRYVPLPQ